LIRIRIQHFRLITGPDPDSRVLMAKNDQKLLASIKDDQVSEEAFSSQKSKENIQHFKI
jgi:hypothetical protein